MSQKSKNYQLQPEVIKLPASSTRVEVSPDGKWIATACFDKKLRLYEAKTFKLVRTISTGTPEARILNFTKDGSKLIVGAKSPAVFDMSPLPKDGLPGLKKLVSFKKDFKNAPLASVMDNDDQHLWTVGGYNDAKDNALRKWNISTGDVVEKINLSTIKELDLKIEPIHVTETLKASNNGLWVAVGNSYKDSAHYDYHACVRLFDAKTSKLKWIANFQDKEGSKAIVSARFKFSEDNSVLYVLVAKQHKTTVHKIDIATGKEMGEPLEIPVETSWSWVREREMKNELMCFMVVVFGHHKKVIIVDVKSAEIVWENIFDNSDAFGITFLNKEELLLVELDSYADSLNEWHIYADANKPHKKIETIEEPPVKKKEKDIFLTSFYGSLIKMETKFGSDCLEFMDSTPGRNYKKNQVEEICKMGVPIKFINKMNEFFGFSIDWKSTKSSGLNATGRIKINDVRDVFGDWKNIAYTDETPEQSTLRDFKIIDQNSDTSAAGILFGETKDFTFYVSALDGSPLISLDLDIVGYCEMLHNTRGYVGWHQAVIHLMDNSKYKEITEKFKHDMPLLYEEKNWTWEEFVAKFEEVRLNKVKS